MTNVTQEQIARLETQIAFQEDTIDTLSDMLAEHQQDIAALKNQLNLVQRELKQLHAMQDSGSEGTVPPPHY